MQDGQTTRFTLLFRIRDRRDQHAWAEFIEIYSPGVFMYLRRRGLQDADAADVTQDVFRTVARSIDGFNCDRRQGSFRGWLMSVVRSRLNEYFSARRRHVAGTGDTEMLRRLEDQVAQPGDEGLFDHEYRHSVFDWAVRQVRPQFRGNTWQAFWQTSVDGKPVKQVAKDLGMSEWAVYIARCRVLAELKNKIADAEGDL